MAGNRLDAVTIRRCYDSAQFGRETKASSMQIKVKEDETPQEVLAAAIVKVADAAEKIIKGPLTLEAVETLIHQKCKVSRREIRLVLNAAADLKSYVKGK